MFRPKADNQCYTFRLKSHSHNSAFARVYRGLIVHINQFKNYNLANDLTSGTLFLQNAYGVSPDNSPIPTFVPLSGIVPITEL